MTPAAQPLAIGYVRVNTAKQAEYGALLEAQRKLEGATSSRLRAMFLKALERITAGQRYGNSLRTIAAELEAAGIPTAHGGTRWYVSTIKAALGSAAARELETVFPKIAGA